MPRMYVHVGRHLSSKLISTLNVPCKSWKLVSGQYVTTNWRNYSICNTSHRLQAPARVSFPWRGVCCLAGGTPPPHALCYHDNISWRAAAPRPAHRSWSDSAGSWRDAAAGETSSELWAVSCGLRQLSPPPGRVPRPHWTRRIGSSHKKLRVQCRRFTLRRTRWPLVFPTRLASLAVADRWRRTGRYTLA